MKKLLPCPICGRQFDPDDSVAMPFCSPRCKQIDLGRWLEEGYGLPVEPPEEDVEPPRDEGMITRPQRHP